jgi:endoglucanase
VSTGGGGGGGARTGGSTATGGLGGASGGSRTGGSTGSGGSASTGGQSGTGGSTSGCTSPAPSGSPVALHGQLKVVGTKIQNESGTAVQLKGVSSFWLNWEEPKYAESKAAVQYMRDNWKIQIIRAAMGIEVTDGYLSAKAATQARVDTIVQNAHALGLYVIVDWHTERAVDQTSEAVAFFTGMADKYGKCPNIIYEDYNEPTKVTWDQIKPYHETVVKAIRAKDPDNPIILGTPDWSSGADVAAANPVAGTNLLYTLHFYSCAHAASSRAVGDTAMAKGVALFISEFGLTPADGGVPPNNKVCESEANLWFDWMAKNGISGTAWKLVSGVDSSNIFSSTSKPPADGPFPDSVLSQTTGSSPGHGQLIVNWLRK